MYFPCRCNAYIALKMVSKKVGCFFSKFLHPIALLIMFIPECRTKY